MATDVEEMQEMMREGKLGVRYPKWVLRIQIGR